MLRAVHFCFLVAWLLTPIEAFSQRASDNAVRSADDAFGMNVGGEQIGLYSSGDVRGFSPDSAGNIRLEGIAIDQQARFSDRLVASSTIRAGLAAQGYLLPAPTGIVDFSFRRIGEAPVQSVIAARSQYGGYELTGDFQARAFGGALDATFGAGYNRGESGNGTTDKRANIGATLRLRPREEMDVTLFADYVRTINDDRWPSYFPVEGQLPPRITNRRTNVLLPWVNTPGDDYNLGMVGQYDASFASFSFGVFHSVNKSDRQIGQFFTSVTQEAQGDLAAFIGPSSSSVSNSIEARIARSFADDERRHTLTANVRARARDRVFGGTQFFDFGVGSVETLRPVPEPEMSFGDVSEEDVEQITYGVAYDLQWRGIGNLNLGLQKTDYSRALVENEETLEGSASPFLFSVTGAVNVSANLLAYGGFIRGFEEGPSAPDIALNRNEVLPAIETQQAEVGLRLRLGSMTAVAGVFSIQKPFFALGNDQIFGPNGTVVNRGIELSLAGRITPDLQLVAGAVFLDAKISGEAVEDGRLSADPIGARRRQVTIDLDYRPKWAPGWSGDVSVSHLGPQNGDQIGVVRTRARTIVDLGVRKTLSLKSQTLLIRARLLNLFNAFGWDTSDGGPYFFQEPRGAFLSVGSDF